jgi:hypothetical protein
MPAMRNPLSAIDHWASQSGNRSALILWLASAAMVVLVVIVVVGITLYTAPLPRPH